MQVNNVNGKGSMHVLLALVRYVAVAVCAISLLLFLASAALGGFRIKFSWMVLSCRTPEHVLNVAVVTGAIAAWLTARQRRGQAFSEDGLSGDSPFSTFAWVRVGIASLLVLAALLCRSGYLSYFRLLVRMNDYVYPPLWLSGALYAIVGLGVLGLWLGSRRAVDSVYPRVMLALFTLSPIAFYVSESIAIAFGIVVVLWFLLDWLLDRRFPEVRLWTLMVGLIPAVLVFGIAMHEYGTGWAPPRITGQWNARLAVMPMTSVIALIGLVWVIRRRGGVPHLKSAVVLAMAGGMTFAGTRGLLGDAGAVALVPLSVVLIGQGAEWLLSNRWSSRYVILKNVALIALAGLVIGTARKGLDKTICPPGYRYEETQ